MTFFILKKMFLSLSFRGLKVSQGKADEVGN